MKCVKSIIVGVAMGALAASAMAATVSYDTAVSVTAPAALAPQLQQFNPALGTLTGVTVSLDITITPIVSVLYFGSSPAAFTGAWTGTNPADAPVPGGGGDVPFTVTDPYDNANTSSTDYSWTYGNGVANPGVNYFPDPTATSLSALVSSVPSASFGDYIGNGTYGLDYTSTQTASYQGSGSSMFFGGSWNLDGTATVTYTYTAVPLPASAASGLVLIGVMAMSKRRSLRRQG